MLEGERQGLQQEGSSHFLIDMLQGSTKACLLIHADNAGIFFVSSALHCGNFDRNRCQCWTRAFVRRAIAVIEDI
jgi:hypothetical protein